MKKPRAGWVALWLVALMLLLYADTVAAMVAVWARSDTFAHGFLIAPVSVWLLWRDRRVLAAVPLSPCVPGFGLLAGCGLVWLLSALAMVNSPAQFAWVGMLLSAVLAVFGWALFRAAAFPLLFLFFLPPAGEFLLPVMMEATADFTTWAVAASGVPVYREGLGFRIPSGHWSVVEACSGLRYLIASVVAGSLYAYLTYRSWVRRLVFVALSVVVPIVANWVRAYLIVMLGHVSGNRLAAGADHLVYGWVFFGIVMAALFALGARFREDEDPPSPGTPRGVVPSVSWGPVVLAGVLAAAAPAVLFVLDRAPGAIGVAAALPATVGPWVQVSENTPSNLSPVWRPHWVGAQTQQAAVYSDGRQRVGVVSAYYLPPAGRLTSSDNVLVKSTDPLWAVVSTRQRELAGVGRIQEAVLRGPDARLRVWWVMEVSGVAVDSAHEAALGIATARLAGRSGLARRLAVWTLEDGADNESASERLRHFIATAQPALAWAIRP